MRLLHRWSRAAVRFDEQNLVSCAGLVAVMQVAERAGLSDLVADKVKITGEPVASTGANPVGKVTSIVAGMAAGADSIEDLDVIGTGGMKRLFAGVYAPSTLGSFLRAFTHGQVLQLAAVLRAMLVNLAQQTPMLRGAEELTFVDIDSLLRRVYGHSKRGARFGPAKVGGYQLLLRGLCPLVATISTRLSAPVIAAIRLRGGNAGSARGAASLLTHALNTAKAAGASGMLLVRAGLGLLRRRDRLRCPAGRGVLLHHGQHEHRDPGRHRWYRRGCVDAGALPRRRHRPRHRRVDLRG